MHQSKIPYVLLILLMLLTNFAATGAGNDSDSKEYKLTVTAPERVSVGDTISVTYNLTVNRMIDESPTKFDLGPIDETARFIYGPFICKHTHIVNMGTNTSTKSDLKFTYTFKALKQGTFTTPTLQLNYPDFIIQFSEQKNVLIKSKLQKIEPDRENLDYLDLQIDKSEIALGDSIKLSLILYTTQPPVQFFPLKENGIDDAFVSYDDNISTLEVSMIEKEGKELYQVNIKNLTIIPLRKGKYSVPPIKASVTIQVNEDYDFSTLSFFPSYQDITLSTKPLTFTVK